MRRFAYVPNLLSSLRIALAPAMLGAAYSNAKAGFTVLFVIVLLTDAVDGFLARRWKAESALGRQLDRWGDGLTMVFGATGVFFLWPAPFEREWQWALLALTGYACIGVQRLLLPATTKSVPRWPMRALAWCVPASLLALINDISASPFQIAATVQAIFGLWKLAGAIGREPERAKVGSKAEG